jgi:hypothetical protein
VDRSRLPMASVNVLWTDYVITQLKNIPVECRGGCWYSRSESASVARIETGNFAAFVTGKQKSWNGWAQAGIEVSTRKKRPHYEGVSVFVLLSALYFRHCND